LDPTLVVTEPILEGGKLYGVEKSISLFDCVVSNQSEASNLHDSVQNLYEQVEHPEMKGADMELAKVWSSQMTWNPMLCKKDHKFISGNNNGMSSESENLKF